MPTIFCITRQHSHRLCSSRLGLLGLGLLGFSLGFALHVILPVPSCSDTRIWSKCKHKTTQRTFDKRDALVLREQICKSNQLQVMFSMSGHHQIAAASSARPLASPLVLPLAPAAINQQLRPSARTLALVCRSWRPGTAGPSAARAA
jgi:hypothetical protein